MDIDDPRSVLPETNNNHDQHPSDSGIVLSGSSNKRGGWNTVRVNVLKGDSGSSKDSVIKTVNGAEVVDQEPNLFNQRVEKRRSGIHQVWKMLKDLNRIPKPQPISTEALNGFNFISKNDSPSDRIALDGRFEKLTKDKNGLLSREHFGKCIGMNNESKEFFEKLFDSLCRRRNITGGLINKEQFNEFWAEITNQSFDSRLQIFLDMVDKDKDGEITEEEVTEIIMVSASANKLSTIKKNVDIYASLIMEEIHRDKSENTMVDKLERLLKDAAKHNQRQEKQDSSESSSQKPKTTRSPIIKRYQKLKYFLHDNWKRCWVVVLWIVAMIGLFTWKYIEYKHRAVYDVLGSCVSIAKGAAETLKLNMAIMLLPVCRNTITWLRNKTKLGGVVPFDDNINFHQLIAVAIAIGVGLHAISHLACDFPRLIHATEEEYKPMQQFFGDQAKNYWHFLKEVEGYTGIIMVVLMTIAFTLACLRKGLKLPSFFEKLTKFKAFKNSKLYNAVVKKLTGSIDAINKSKRFKKATGFNVFWYSHHLFVIVYALLIVHGIKLYLTKKWYKKTTWMYLAIPIVLYACERLIRTLRSRTVDQAPILKVAAYPGREGVLALRMKKPKNFDYKSGEYMFVKCAAISPFEWHPFSITSAPSDAYLSVHIRGLGDWTKKINETFRDPEICSLDERTGTFRGDFTEENPLVPKVIIDGPYGAPAQDYTKFDVVLLVGLGIGATPMISILKDIVNNIKANEEKGQTLEDGTRLEKNQLSPTSAHEFKTQRAYFYWSTKEQDSFGWFEDVINEVAELAKNDVIEIHNYCTSVFEEGDARSALITMLQSLYLAKHGFDVVSGTRVKCHFARPNWREIYKKVADNHKGSRIGVFYCGQPGVAKKLKELASEFSDSSTKFEFHKENF